MSFDRCRDTEHRLHLLFWDDHVVTDDGGVEWFRESGEMWAFLTRLKSGATLRELLALAEADE